MKKIISIIAFLSFAFVGIAQEEQSEVSEFAPEKNDILVSINFGAGSYIGHGAPQPNLSHYSLSAPMQAWFSKTPILDIEGKWFLSDKIALKLGGGFSLGYNPAYKEVTGTADNDKFELGDLPTYRAVPSSDNIQYSINLGGDYYIASKSDRIFLRIGGEVGFAYGRVTVNGVDDDNYLGASIGEAYSFRVAPVAGVDYFFSKHFFLGLEFRPLAYRYSVYSERPQVGLSLLSSDNHSFSFIAQPGIKLGFRF